MKDENFGYSLSQPELTNEDGVQALRETIRYSKRDTLASLLGTFAFPYFMEKCSGKFSEPFDSTIFSGLLLLEILAVGACLYSAYTWRRASKYKDELEQLIDEE